MIDKERFEEFYHYFDADTMIELIDLFIKEKKDRIEALHVLSDTKDYKNLAQQVHSLKSVIGNFMDETAYQLACSLEGYALAHEEQEVLKTLPALEKACDELMMELKDIKRSFQTNEGITY